MVAVAIWLVAPTLVVVPLSLTDRDSFAFPPKGWSLKYYEIFFTEPSWRNALLTSVQIAFEVTVVATTLGTAAAFALTRSRFKGKSVVNAALMAPMIVPGIVAAVAIFAAFLKWRLVGDPVGFILAHTVLAIPFVVVSVTASLEHFDRDLERAAAALGSGPLTTFRLVTLRLIMPGILSGAVFAFVTSFDEVVVALYLSDPIVRTLPVQMYTSSTSETDPTIAAASTVILSATTALVLLPQLFRRVKDD
ncbi:ABC transporter permease [Nocardia gipuzkoensis]|uniref:ABC transporter permease n=1 Tax=Nocardia abscessus TaxID=120957 RepID=UPI002B4B028F|nr:ABC transporter permease [Nocardia abscessus]